MPLPLIPVVLIATGSITGAGGAALGIKGGVDIKRANQRIKKAGARYDEARHSLETLAERTNEALRVLGNQQEQATRLVVLRMADLLRRHEKQVSESEKLLVDGLDSAPGEVSIEESLEQDAVAWIRGIAGSAVTVAGVNAGITSAVTAFASASTGTAISSLSGAAATNATLAFLGGGSAAAGGGGMAVGAAALNFVTIGPAILVSGLVVAGQGEKAKTAAQRNEALVNVAIAEMDETRARFDAIVSRARELGELLNEFIVRGTNALDMLESEPFDPERHAARFQQALVLTMAVRDIAATPVVDETGGLNPETADFRLRYRNLIKEGANDG